MALPSLEQLQHRYDHVIDAVQKRGLRPGRNNTTGVRKGLRVGLQPPGQSRRPTRPADTNTIGQVPLSRRRVAAERPIQRMDLALIASVAQQMHFTKAEFANELRRIRSNPGSALAGRVGGRQGGRLASVDYKKARLQLLAGQAELGLLEASDQDEVIARQTPVGDFGESAQDLTHRFQEALAQAEQESDAAALEENSALALLLQPLRKAGARLGTVAEVIEELQQLDLYKEGARSRLMRWLDGKLPVPRVADKDREARKQAIRDQLNFAKGTPEGIEAQAAINVQDVAQETEDPEAFTSAHGRLLTQPEDASFAEYLLVVLGPHNESIDLQAAVAQGQKALAHDAAALNPSVNPEYLHVLIRKLGELTLASTVVALMKELKAQLGRTVLRGVQAATITANGMLRRLLEIIIDPNRNTSPHTYLRYQEELGVQGLAAGINVLRGIGEIVRRMPPKCFPSDEKWLEIRNAIASALDDLIVREEDLANASASTAQVP